MFSRVPGLTNINNLLLSPVMPVVRIKNIFRHCRLNCANSHPYLRITGADAKGHLPSLSPLQLLIMESNKGQQYAKG
jgi:hypothetical protein